MPGLFEVGAHQAEQFLHALGALRIGLGGLAEVFADVGFEYFGHQTVDRAAEGGDLLEHGAAIGAGFERAFQAVALATDAPHAGEDALFFFGGMGHG